MEIRYKPDALYPDYKTVRLENIGEDMTNQKRRLDDRMEEIRQRELEPDAHGGQAITAGADGVDWRPYHSALSQCAELLDNMKDGDPITMTPAFLAAKLMQMKSAGAAREGGNTSLEGLDRWWFGEDWPHKSEDGQWLWYEDVKRLFASVPPLTAPAPLTDDDQWIFDLAAKHESRGKELFGPITFSSTAILDFARELLAKAAPAAPVQTAEPVAWMTADKRMLIFADVLKGNLDTSTDGMTPLYAALPAQTDKGQIRNEALEEAAEHLDRLNEASGDAAAYDQRDMHPGELEREYAFSDCAKAIRALIAPSTGEASNQQGGAE